LALAILFDYNLFCHSWIFLLLILVTLTWQAEFVFFSLLLFCGMEHPHVGRGLVPVVSVSGVYLEHVP
jgi:hypothetical protein